MNGFVGVPNSSTGAPVDVSVLQIGGRQVNRQRFVLGDDTDAAGLASVTGARPAINAIGLVVRPINPASSASLTSGVAWIYANGNTIVKASAGHLSRVIVNSAGGTGNFAQLWDGDPISGGKQFANINLSIMPSTLTYEIDFSTSLHVVTTGSSECGDLTLIFE